jgi:hypothetical protein
MSFSPMFLLYFLALAISRLDCMGRLFDETVSSHGGNALSRFILLHAFFIFLVVDDDLRDRSAFDNARSAGIGGYVGCSLSEHFHVNMSYTGWSLYSLGI